MTVTAFIKDSSKRRWRIMAHADMATQLLTCEIGDRIKLTGIKGDLCQGAWDNAKRQIVPYSGRLMIGRVGALIFIPLILRKVNGNKQESRKTAKS